MTDEKKNEHICNLAGNVAAYLGKLDFDFGISDGKKLLSNWHDESIASLNIIKKLASGEMDEDAEDDQYPLSDCVDEDRCSVNGCQVESCRVEAENVNSDAYKMMPEQAKKVLNCISILDFCHGYLYANKEDENNIKNNTIDLIGLRLRDVKEVLNEYRTLLESGCGSCPQKQS